MTLNVYVANLSLYAAGVLKGIWVNLPADPEELENTLCKIGVGPGQEFFIPDVDSDIDGLSSVIGEYDSLREINALAEDLDTLNTWELETVEAVIELQSPDLQQLKEVLDNLSDYTLLSNVETDEDLGCYFVDELGCLSVPDNLRPYFDYAAYGRDVRLESSGGFVAGGFLLAP